MRRHTCPRLLMGFVLAYAWCASLNAAPAHPHPYLMPPAEKQRLLQRIQTSKTTRRQYEQIEARAEQGAPGDAALVFALEGDPKYAAVVCEHLLHLVETRGPHLDEDIAAGGHREGNMDFYWDTSEVRWYDLIYPALSSEDRQTIETFYRKLGHYWKDSLDRWTTTPNLVFPIHYHGAVIGFCIDDPQLIEWGLHNTGGKFGPSRGGLFPVLDSMLRDGMIWDEATIYAAVNVLQPMVQLAILHKLYDGKDIFAHESARGGSIRNLLDGYIALGYPIERTGVGPGSFHVATYGDGSTESPYSKHHGTDSLYLVNLPWVRDNYRYEIIDCLEQAYFVRRDPKYAWFLSHAVEREPSFLYGEVIPVGTVPPPPAPSSVFPEAGIAMLRADESPDYWTNGSIAVLQMMGRGYGHDHRDKMMIVMHAGGRLLYPDMNCIQYEPPSINWTANTVAHNTLVVDRGKTANSSFTYRHEFTPDVKFLATTANCYPGVVQTRALALTSDYLLDLFWADSDLPHTYDWVLHGIGNLQCEHPALYEPSSDLLQDYWWIEKERARETAQTWRADFIQRSGLAIRGMGRQTDEWFDDRAAVRVTMVGESGSTVYGAEGPTGGPPMDPVMNPEGNLPLLLVRREARRTVFAALHEPFKQSTPTIADVRKLAASRDAYVAEVRSTGYVDRVAIAFGEQSGTPKHALRCERDPHEVFLFSNYGYLRQERPLGNKRPHLVARGNWTGFRVHCPELSATEGLTLNGKHVRYKKEGDYVVFGDVSEISAPNQMTIAVESSLPEWVVPGQEVELAWTLRNTGSTPIRDVHMRLSVPAGCDDGELSRRADEIAASGQWRTRLSLHMPASLDQRRSTVAVVPIVSYTSGGHRRSIHGPKQATMLVPPLEITAEAEPVRLAARDSREVTLRLRNWSPMDQAARVRILLPPGITPEPADGRVVTNDQQRDGGIRSEWTLPPVAAGQTKDVPLRLATGDGAKGGLHRAAVQVAAFGSEDWTVPVALPITVGPVLLEDDSFPTFGEYVVYAPRYTFRLSKRYGTSRFLRDDANRPRFEATFWNRRPPAETSPDALPRIRVEERDALAWGSPAQFLWPNATPASVTVGTRKSRIRWDFEDNAVRLEPVALWSAEAPHEFIFPGQQFGWTSWGGKPKWLHIVAVDQAGRQQLLSEPSPSGQEILAAALQVPGFEEVVCFAVDRAQIAHFDGEAIRLSIQPGDSLWFGLARPNEFESWWHARIKK